MSLSAARTGGDGALVVVDGALDYHTTQDLAELFGELAGEGIVKIAIDLERASPIDDGAIGVLFRALIAAREAGGALAIGTSEDRLRDALGTMGIDRVLRIAGDRDGALAALGLQAPDGW